jgi:DNA-binding XRE family transcriptional regulator
LSGVDRITIMRIEKGKNAKVDNFVKILIALNKLLRID